MADFGQETVQVTRRRFLLRAETNGTQLQKMLSAAANVRAQQLDIHPTELPDDALRVSVEDEDIVIWWEEDEEVMQR
jgi:hypothetical protein